MTAQSSVQAQAVPQGLPNGNAKAQANYAESDSSSPPSSPELLQRQYSRNLFLHTHKQCQDVMKELKEDQSEPTPDSPEHKFRERALRNIPAPLPSSSIEMASISAVH